MIKSSPLRSESLSDSVRVCPDAPPSRPNRPLRGIPQRISSGLAVALLLSFTACGTPTPPSTSRSSPTGSAESGNLESKIAMLARQCQTAVSSAKLPPSDQVCSYGPSVPSTSQRTAATTAVGKAAALLCQSLIPPSPPTPVFLSTNTYTQINPTSPYILECGWDFGPRRLFYLDVGRRPDISDPASAVSGVPGAAALPDGSYRTLHVGLDAFDHDYERYFPDHWQVGLEADDGAEVPTPWTESFDAIAQEIHSRATAGS